MQCAYHPDREPVGACVACGRLICVECKALLGGKIYCSPCADKIFVHEKTEPAKPERAESSARQQPKTEAQAQKVTTKSEPILQTASKTAGQRKWKRWVIGLFIAIVVLAIIYAIIAAVLVATGVAEFSF
jgi:hypothetical protein